jgi:plasmid stabilization system protein ParE
VVRKSIKINWEDEAKAQLKQACTYIRKDSVKNSEKVKREILSAVTLLSSQPERYQLDKYKLNNDGSYRAFELYHYRVVYRVMHLEIKVLTIRHTKMEPIEY